MKNIDSGLLSNILAQFDFNGPVRSAAPYGEGHINSTFLVTNTVGEKYILQRINTDTFQNPDALMENICRVTDYLKRLIEQRGGDPKRETLTVRTTLDGKTCFHDAEMGAWRVYDFVEDTLCLQQVRTPQDLYTVGITFGKFQHMLADYPAGTLHETIARFHDTPKRYADFEKALAADAFDRAKDCADEIAFIRAREADCHVLVDLLAAGKLPLRVTHNDTKLNNVLIDRSSGEGICVIDLDTVMPGLSLYDFGDTVRFGANDCAEDEQDLTKVNFSLPLYETFARGFLDGCGDILTPAEKEYLPWGAKLMTLECGIRFLADHLEGDHYFNIHRPGHNLDRARTQLKLVADMEQSWDEMNAVIKKYGEASNT